MRIFFLSLSIVIFTSCGASKVQKQIDKEKRLSDKEFTLVSSTINSWTGGIKGVKGYNLSFVFTGNSLDKMVIDSVWFYDNKAMRPIFQVKSDSIFIEGSYSDSKNIVFKDIETGKDKSAELNFKSPIKYDGDALIRAYLKGEERYFVIDSLVQINQAVEIK